MKALNKIKAIVLGGCAIFTAVTFFMCALGTLFSDGKLATTFPALLGFFVFSLVLSCLGEVLKIKSIHPALRIVLHFIGSMVCFYGVFIRLGAFSEKISGKLVIMVLSAIIYAVIAAVILIIRHIRFGLKRDNEKYEAQFKFDK